MIERPHYGDTDFITGMRAWAAMAVVLIHSGGAGLRSLGAFGDAIVDFGSSGVYAFFVISGFSVSHSITKSSGYADYMTRRLFRILPVYYLYILVVGLIIGASAENLIMHLLMVSWLDVEIANSILQVEWSIPVEVFWYLLIPLLFAVARRSGWHLAAVLAFTFASYGIAERVSDAAGFSRLALHWSPFRYAFLFALGVAAFMIRDRRPSMPAWASDAAVLFAALLIGAHLVRPMMEPLFVAGIATAAIVAFARGSSLTVKTLFLSPPALWIGAISYSLYLAHMPIFRFLRTMMDNGTPLLFMVGTSLALAVAFASYVLVERPSITLGRMLRRRSAAQA